MSNFTKIIIGISLIGLIILAGLFWFQNKIESSRTAPLPIAQSSDGLGGTFNLTNQDGETFGTDSIDNGLIIAYFGYSHCPDVCGTSLLKISEALDELSPEELASVTPIFITVDPERDTQERLKTYISYFHPSLIALTGTEEEIKHVALDTYRVYYSYGEPNETGYYSVDHSSYFYILNSDGEVLDLLGHDSTPVEISTQLRAFIGS